MGQEVGKISPGTFFFFSHMLSTTVAGTGGYSSRMTSLFKCLVWNCWETAQLPFPLLAVLELSMWSLQPGSQTSYMVTLGFQSPWWKWCLKTTRGTGRALSLAWILLLPKTSLPAYPLNCDRLCVAVKTVLCSILNCVHIFSHWWKFCEARSMLDFPCYSPWCITQSL